jgi:hypothetical protein
MSVNGGMVVVGLITRAWQQGSPVRKLDGVDQRSCWSRTTTTTPIVGPAPAKCGCCAHSSGPQPPGKRSTVTNVILNTNRNFPSGKMDMQLYHKCAFCANLPGVGWGTLVRWSTYFVLK